ncbi:MAG: Ig-like domain-containing protein [Marinibacterium sp.]|nr:Ig-like domain-containing protein [Marinibacterium sp.]
MARITVPTINGVLVGDQRLDQVLLLQDLDGNGKADGAGETTVFFDANNLSGLPSPTGNVFTIHQAADLSVFVGDGSADAVYRLRDRNNDGDAQDAGEAEIWFSADNAAGFSTITPNGVAQGEDGAIYIANAGTRSTPQDAIYRTVDLNGDGDADDAGEATLWLDLQTIIDTSVPFDLSFHGDVAYLTDLTGTAPDVVHRIEDLNGDGTIQTDEVTAFITDDASFGAPVDIAGAVAADGSFYSATWFPDRGEIFKLYRLTDLDGSGKIDSVHEAREVWNANMLPEGIGADIGFSLAVDDDGTVVLTANSFAGQSSIVRLENLNGDGDFFDAGETVLFGSESYDAQLDRARAVEFYSGEGQPVAASVGAGNHFSVFLRDNVIYASGENVVRQLDNGTTGFDVKAPMAILMPDGFDATITSVSSGTLHTTFLTDDGDVYAFGHNNRGMLGLGDDEDRSRAEKIDALDDVDVIAIENGNGVSFALDADGVLYSWGSNTNGQLGHGDRDTRMVPTPVEVFGGERVVAVSSGTSHTLALTAEGEVYAFGSNTDGQADGSGERRVVDPTQVDGLPDDIIGVTAVGRTSFAVTSDGRVFGWGESKYGQMLVGSDNGDGTFTVDPADVRIPVELTALPDNVIDVEGGARWAIALTADGDVYAWGPNDEGPTGGLDGDPAAASDASFLPTKIAELDDVTIVEIQAGPNSIIAVSDTGQVFAWGSNSDGRLGFVSDGSVYAPVEVDFDADAAPFLQSAMPGDNAREVGNDASLVLSFTEAVSTATGTITLVNRDTGARTDIDVTDPLLVQVDGSTVTVTPPAHLDVDTRYAVEISDGAFVDGAGQAYAGIAEGDTSTFNFTTSDTAAASNLTPGTRDADLIRGGADDDQIMGGRGDDRLSGGTGADELRGQAGHDILDGGTGDDRLIGAAGDDDLTGGAGADRLLGGGGVDFLSGGEGRDLLRGDAGDDLLIDGAGADKLIGGTGADVFDLVTDGDTDRIADFELGTDKIRLNGVSDFAVLDIADVSNGGVRIEYNGDMLLLLEDGGAIDAADLTASDFLFV